jgi:AraC-like DNA-binding protein
MKRGALYVKAIAFKDFPRVIRSLGGSPETLFAQSELDMSYALKGDNYYDWDKACGLVELSARELGEPSLGLKWAHEVPTDFLTSGPMILLGALIPTIRDFFDLGIMYQKLHVSGIKYSYSENEVKEEVQAVIQIHPASPPCRQMIEHIMATIFLMERHYLGAFKYKELTFQHNAPDDISWHEKTFKCPVEFNSDKTGACIPSSLLNVKLGGKLKSLAPIVKLYLDRKLDSNTAFETSMAQTVEQILPMVFGMRKSRQIDVASILEISPKKLQRLLNEEDVSYSDILGNVRKSMTERLLYESDIAISHLAVLLDYSSNEAFNSACQRWFGLSPRQYRKKLRASND